MAHAEDEITLPKLSAPVRAQPSGKGAPDERWWETEDEVTLSRPIEKIEKIEKVEPPRWLVQLDLEAEQVVRLYRMGLARGAVVWRDGMQEWRPLLIMRELRQAVAVHTARMSKTARLRLSSLSSLPVTKPAAVPAPAREATQVALPQPALSATVPAAGDVRTSAAQPAPPEPPASSGDAGLSLLMELTHPRSRTRSARFTPVIETTSSPPTPPAMVVQVLPAPASAPAPLPTAPAGVRAAVNPPRPRASSSGGLAVTATALCAVAATALFFWFGPVRTARDTASQAERALALLSPRTAARVEPSRAPTPARVSIETSSAARAAEDIPVLDFSELGDPVSERSSRETSERESTPVRGARTKPARGSTAAPRLVPASSNGAPDRGAIARALAKAAAAASGCNESGSGSARAVVTFAPSGVARSVAFEKALPAGVNRGCAYRALSHARIPPFSGDPVTVRKTLRF